jgi:predicted enzyme related to lactoylglutathione lyase
VSDTKTKGIKTILHPVADLTAAKPLYVALLGAEPSADSEWYVGFDVGGVHVGLLPGGGPQQLTSPVAYWEVDDIDAKLTEVTAAGATVKDAVSEVGGGRRVATFTDADGNVVGLLQDS